MNVYECRFGLERRRIEANTEEEARAKFTALLSKRIESHLISTGEVSSNEEQKNNNAQPATRS